MARDRGEKPVVHTKKHLARLERERRQTRILLYSFIGIVIIVLGLIIYGYLDMTVFQLRQPVAKVGDTVLTTAEFQARVRLERTRLLNIYMQYSQLSQLGLDVTNQLQQIQNTLNNSTTLGQNVLDQMINEEIIRQEAAKRGITVSQQELDEAIQAAYRYYPNGTPTPTVTPTEITYPTLSPASLALITATPLYTATPTLTATFEPTATPILATQTTPSTDLTVTPTLEPTATFTPAPSETPTATPTEGPTATPFPTATPYTLEGFQADYTKSLEQITKSGLTEAQYRQLFETSLLRDKLMEIITADVPHEQEQIWARHILVADEATAKLVLERLKKGEDFAKLATELSQDPGSAPKGGDLGWFGRGVMVKPFEEAAFNLKNIGDISEPVQTQFGWHIIQLIARQMRPLTADEYTQARDKAFQDWLTQARDEYKVQIFDYWKERVPAEPNFNTLATQAATGK
ncbi:MAG: peptidylprolyl isomerase [Anaerolineae bacterium]